MSDQKTQGFVNTVPVCLLSPVALIIEDALEGVGRLPINRNEPFVDTKRPNERKVKGNYA